jgi:hypothetical protein
MTLISNNDGTTVVSYPSLNQIKLYDTSVNELNTISTTSLIGGLTANFSEEIVVIGLPEDSENKNIKTFQFDGTEIYNSEYITGTNLGDFVHLTNENVLSVSSYNDTDTSSFQISNYETNISHKAINISTISNIEYPDLSTNFAITLTTNDVSLSVIENNLSIDPSNVANITNTTLTNYGFTLEGQIDVSGEHNVSGVKLFYEDFSSNAFDIYSIQDLSINGFVFDNSAVTYENYQSNNITLTLNRNDLTNVDISNSLQISPPSCGQIVNVSGSEYTRTITFTPTFYILESDCSLTFHFTNAQLDASMTIPFSVDTLQQIEDISMNPRSILEPNSVSTLGVKFRLPVETPGIAPDVTISPSYIANINSISAISGDTWTGTIIKADNMTLLYNTIDFSYNGFDTSLNFNVAQNPELIVGPREIGDFVECKGIKITSSSLTEAFTINEIMIMDENGIINNSSESFYDKSSGIDAASIMNGNINDTSTVSATTELEEKWFKIVFATNKKIKEITIYASHSVKIELLGIQITPDVDNIIANLGQVNVDVSGTINIANASTQSTITRAVTDITLDPSNIVYPDVSSNFEMLFSTNTVSLLDISNTYLSFYPSNAANLTNLSLTDNDFKLVGKIEANDKIFKEDCKLKYDETIDISGEKQLAIKDLFISSSSIVPKTDGVSSINFEHNVGELELIFTLYNPDLKISDFLVNNSAVISNLTKNGLKWNADITFPRTDSDVSVNYNIDVNYKSGDTYSILKIYNTYVPIVGDNISVLDIYDKVPVPTPGEYDISINDNTILTSGSPTEKRAKREVFIERLLDTYKDNLKTTTEKLVMKTEELLGTDSGITKNKIKIIDNFDVSGNKLTDITFNSQELNGDEAVYVPLDVSGASITFDTYSSKLKIEKISDTSFNVYENYDDSNPIITKVMTFDETSIYDLFQYKIGTVEGENVPAITNITLNPSNIISDLSSNLQVEFSQPASQPIITIDPSYIAELDGSMTMVDSSGYIWSGTINRTLEMNRLDNILTVSGEHHSLYISFNVVEDSSYINGSNELTRILKPISIPSDILYPDNSSNFELLFTTNDKTLNDISGNLQLDPSGVGNLTNLQLAHSGFKLVGNIEAHTLTKNKDTKLEYFETEDVSGESNLFDIYTYPPFQLVNFALTPENIVGPNDVSSNLQIEFNIPISTDTSLNNYITIDPSYIVNLEDMTSDNGYTWSGVMNKGQYMNKLGNKLEINYTDTSLSDLNDNPFTVSTELVFNVLESKNVLKWEKKIDTSLNETFNETVEISPNGQILAQISGSGAKIFHLQSDSTWSLEEEISGNHLALCDNRIAIATDLSLQVYEYDSSWSQIGSSISASNVSNLDISIDGNRVAYIYDVSSVGVYKFFEGSWSSMIITGTITGNSVKFSPNGLLLGVGTLDSENQNFSNVVLYEYNDSSWNLKT